MSPGKKKKRPTKGSFLTRLLGSDKGKAAGNGARKPRAARANGKPSRAAANKPGAAEGDAAPKARALTPLERSIQEIKQMAKVGESDPQRLAMLLSNLLAGEQAKRQQDQQSFDEMISDLVDRREGEEDG